MPNNQFSPEYKKRRAEILAEVKRMGVVKTANHILHLENDAKKSYETERELRKVVTKYQAIFGRLMTVLTASTNLSSSKRSHGGGCTQNGLNLPFNYEIAFNNCRVIIADYFEDLKILNPGGSYWNGGKRVAKECARKLERMRSV